MSFFCFSLCQNEKWTKDCLTRKCNISIFNVFFVLEGEMDAGLFDSQTQQQVVGSTSSAAEGSAQPDEQEVGQGEGALGCGGRLR